MTIATVERVPVQGNLVPAQGQEALDAPQAEYLDATTRYTQIRGALMEAMKSFLKAGMHLETALVRDDWRTLGYSSFGEYCSTGLHISKSVAYDLIRIRQLADQFPQQQERIVSIGQAKIRLLLPHLPYDQTEHEYTCEEGLVNEYLHEAESLSWEDLRQRLNGNSAPNPRDVTPEQQVARLTERMELLERAVLRAVEDLERICTMVGDRDVINFAQTEREQLLTTLGTRL